MITPQPPHGEQLALSAADRAKIFRESYNEALLFLKHQDDKINRVLTALAFLTAAGVSLYIFSRPQQAADSPMFENAYFGADDYFFASFLIGLFVSVAFALVALDPTSFVPRFFRPISDRSSSLLFYRAMADQSKEEWDRIYDDPNLSERLARAFHADARRLSNRAVHKVRRFSSANAVVQFTVATLTLLGVMRLATLDVADRWWLATAVLIGYSALPALDFLYFRFLDFPEVGSDYAVRHPFLVGLGFWLPFFVVSTLALVLAHQEWQPVTFTLFGTLALRWISSFEWQALGRGLVAAVLGASSALTLAGAIWMVWLS